jgi:hypothetical protein
VPTYVSINMGLVRTICAAVALTGYAAPASKEAALAGSWMTKAVDSLAKLEPAEKQKFTDATALEKLGAAKDDKAYLKMFLDAAPKDALKKAVEIGKEQVKTDKEELAKEEGELKKDKDNETRKSALEEAKKTLEKSEKALALLQPKEACMNCLCISILSAIGVIVVIGVVLLVCVMKGKKEQEEEDAEV